MGEDGLDDGTLSSHEVGIVGLGEQGEAGLLEDGLDAVVEALEFDLGLGLEFGVLEVEGGLGAEPGVGVGGLAEAAGLVEASGGPGLLDFGGLEGGDDAAALDDVDDGRFADEFDEVGGLGGVEARGVEREGLVPKD